MKRSNAKSLSDWDRSERMSVFISPRRARYPGIIRHSDGTLSVFFTNQSEQQESQGIADLMCTHSGDRGQTWSSPEPVYHGATGEPVAEGTATTLRSGGYIVPFVVKSNGGTESSLRIVKSDVGGTWKVFEPSIDSPLVWFSPHGRIVESGDGNLVMTVYGCTSESELRATEHGCGLLRSQDGGQSWGSFSWIVKSGTSVIGAHSDTRFSFEGGSIQTLSDGRWLAMVNARRLEAGAGSAQVLCRLWSEDEGQSWSQPDQLTVGSFPSLAQIDERISVCAFTCYCAWGTMRLILSDDGFETFFRELPLHERGWLIGFHTLEEVPLPPLVPLLGDGWQYEHFGFPAAVALDADTLAVVFARTHRGTVYWNPSGGLDNSHELALDAPMEQERIELVIFRRQEKELQMGNRSRVGRGAYGRWILSERLKPAAIGVGQLPQGEIVGVNTERIFLRTSDGVHWNEIEGAAVPGKIAYRLGQKGYYHGDLFGCLKSGRWLLAESNEVSHSTEGQPTRVGERGGYPLLKEPRYKVNVFLTIWISDDMGKTWTKGQTLRDPLAWSHPYGRMLELDDGTLLLSVYGAVPGEDEESYAGCNGIFRSVDQGETWGDFMVIFRHEPKKPEDPQPDPRYTEIDVLSIADGRFLALSRTEYKCQGPKTLAAQLSRSFSDDLGRTWSKPEARFMLVGTQEKAIQLPDGGIFVSKKSHSYQDAGAYITYDNFDTVSYAVGGPYGIYSAFKLNDDRIVVYAPGNGGFSRHEAALYSYQAANTIV